jgi:hypothetical protein
MTRTTENSIISTISQIMKNKNYRAAYEEALIIAKEMKVRERIDFFPFIFALDIRGEEAYLFMNEVINAD